MPNEPVASPAAQQAAAAPRVSLCADGEERRQVAGRIVGSAIELRAECDTGSALAVRAVSLPLPSPSGSPDPEEALLRLSDPALAPRQALEAPIEDGAPYRFLLSTGRARCRPVLATPSGEPPIPARFTDRHGRWTLSLGFLADPGCRFVVVYSGNEAALLSAGSPKPASIYNLSLALGDT